MVNTTALNDGPERSTPPTMNQAYAGAARFFDTRHRYNGGVSVETTLPLEELQPAAAHISLGVYLRRIWERRSYLVHVPRNELRNRNMHTVLGNAWNLLNPILAIAVYFLVFGLLLDTTRGVEYFIPFLAIGVFAFQFSQRSATAGARSLVANRGLLRSINFPRALLPLTSTFTETLAFMPTIAVFYIVSVAAGVPFTWMWVLVLPLAGLQVLFNVGMSLVFARMNNGFRDIENILPFLFRLLFYGSGVLFYVGAYVEDSRLRTLFVANPLFSLLTLYRGAVLGMPVVWTELVSVIAWTLALLVGGLWWFRRAEASYGG